VCPSIAISPATLPPATVGAAYNQTLTASGGTAPYVFTVSGGALPAGMTLSSAGVVGGTPTAAGSTLVTIRATDASGCFAERDFTIIVIPAVPSLPQTFAILLALGLAAIGYMRVRNTRRA